MSKLNNTTTNNNSSNNSSNNKGTAKRIRTPNDSDVLLGRGGGINGHPGNKVFREWVRVRKEDYNLAGTKAEKARVAHEVMNLVLRQGGRFLQRVSDPGTPGWWMQVDEARALSKTSQALREGAPQIRAAHKAELQPTRTRTPSSRKRKAPSQTPAAVPPITPASIATAWPQTVPVVPANTELTAEAKPRPAAETTVPQNSLPQQSQQPQQLSAVPPVALTTAPEPSVVSPQQPPKKILKMLPTAPETTTTTETTFDGYAETPPLASAPSGLSDIPSLDLDAPPAIPLPSSSENKNHIKRSHSLAMSDMSEFPDEFVNPFLDESDIFNSTASFSSSSPSNPLLLSKSPSRSSFVRNVSSDEGREDYRSMAELYDFPTNVGDFNEELKTVMDAVNPDGALTGGKEMPTLLIPWRGGHLKRHYSNGTSLTSSSSRSLGNGVRLNDRQ